MSQDERSSPTLARRCPNCGTRVAQNAETCYFCGHDLTADTSRSRRITWLDLALAVALILVVVFWWQRGNRPDTRAQATEVAGAVPPVTQVQAAPVTEPAVSEAAASAPTPEPTPHPEPLVVRHVVQAGETLLAIAGQYGVSVEEIQAANGLTGELIRAGDILLVPVPEALAETTGSADESASAPSVFKYVVQPGDTIISIAVRFGTQVETILQANRIGPNDFIRPDQTLRLPVEDVPAEVIASSESARDFPGRARPAELYEGPRLIGPGDGATIPRTEEALFRWLSVDLLQPNEWYVLRIWPTAGITTLPPAVWTKATSYRLSTKWAPATGRSATYGWQVTVVRVLPDRGDGREIQAASQSSEVRNFVWQ